MIFALAITSLIAMVVSTPVKPTCSVKYCAFYGAPAPCQYPPTHAHERTVDNCTAWMAGSHALDCAAPCPAGCSDAESGSVVSSDGVQHCNVCMLRRASCQVGFTITGPTSWAKGMTNGDELIPSMLPIGPMLADEWGLVADEDMVASPTLWDNSFPSPMWSVEVMASAEPSVFVRSPSPVARLPKGMPAFSPEATLHGTGKSPRARQSRPTVLGLPKMVTSRRGG